MAENNSLNTQASGTALATAFMRALAAHDPRPTIRGNDYLAEVFLPEEQKKALQDPAARAWVMQNRTTPGAYEFMIARTIFFDQIVQHALRENIPQLVFLGAGYDSRPYRFQQFIQDTCLFELDTEPTQRRKRECLQLAQISISDHIRFVAVNFESDPVLNCLVEAGFNPQKPTLFIWEGVTYYLSVEAIENMLGFVRSNSPAGSTICFDYVALSGPALTENGALELRKLMRSKYPNEPTKFGIRAGEIETFLAQRGFEVIEHLTAAEMNARYLHGGETQEIGQVPGLFCLVHARVV